MTDSIYFDDRVGVNEFFGTRNGHKWDTRDSTTRNTSQSYFPRGCYEPHNSKFNIPPSRHVKQKYTLPPPEVLRAEFRAVTAYHRAREKLSSPPKRMAKDDSIVPPKPIIPKLSLVDTETKQKFDKRYKLKSGKVLFQPPDVIQTARVLGKEHEEIISSLEREPIMTFNRLPSINLVQTVNVAPKISISVINANSIPETKLTPRLGYNSMPSTARRYKKSPRQKMAKAIELAVQAVNLDTKTPIKSKRSPRKKMKEEDFFITGFNNDDSFEEDTDDLALGESIQRTEPLYINIPSSKPNSPRKSAFTPKTVSTPLTIESLTRVEAPLTAEDLLFNT